MIRSDQRSLPQVFDKALLEPVFSELYATLCHDLSKALPEFDPEPGQGDTKKISFRPSLLNKCQIEFQHGAKAIEAVEAREQARAKVGSLASDDKSLNAYCKSIFKELQAPTAY